MIILDLNPNIKFLQKRLRSEGSDIGLIIHYDFSRAEPNMLYFAGYEGVGILAIPSAKRPFLIVPKMEEQRAKACNVRVLADRSKPIETLLDELGKNRICCKQIGFDFSTLPYGMYRNMSKRLGRFRSRNIGNMCLNQRMIKSKTELDALSEAAKITDFVLQSCIRSFKDFRTESDVAAYLGYETQKAGCSLAFDTIVASGASGSKPHYNPMAVKLGKGFCVIDFGVKYKGYCADITRTLYLWGKPTPEEISDYNAVRNVQETCISMVKAGASCKDIYDKASTVLGNDFNHGLGHGLGLAVHEYPVLGPSSKDRLEDGCVFTIEPGLYRAGRYGIRIEDDVAMIGDKAVVLTKTPRDLIIVR